MIARFVSAFFGLALAATSALSAAMPMAKPTPPPTAQGAEVAFVSALQKDLTARFSTIADAEKAGYFRYTNEDNTGSISYANNQWQSADPEHPSQLWYDVKGNLLGADYSVLQSTSKTEPSLWGVNPARWEKFGAHMHYVLTDASGNETYGARRTKAFLAAGGDLNDPTAATLVKMGVTKDAASVKHVFQFPAIWDLQVWIMPNPNGAFAEMNPNVVPSANAEKSMD